MALVLEIKVVPLSGRCAWKLDKNGQLKCYLKSAPERGQANSELIQLIARALGVPQAQVAIISGATHRLKKVKIASDVTYDQLLNLLGVPRQTDEHIDRQVGIFEK
jgi:uncharacterized protein YggU (UPF0235/DUF167 family)